MSEARSFFRHCPACGRRFHIKLLSKKLTGERKEVTQMKLASLLPSGGLGAGRYPAPSYVVVEENVPITIDIDEFQYAYKCKHCGHLWSEMRTEETKA